MIILRTSLNLALKNPPAPLQGGLERMFLTSQDLTQIFPYIFGKQWYGMGRELHGMACFKYNGWSCRWFEANAFFFWYPISPSKCDCDFACIDSENFGLFSQIESLTTCRAHPPKTKLFDSQSAMGMPGCFPPSGPVLTAPLPGIPSSHRYAQLR